MKLLLLTIGCLIVGTKVSAQDEKPFEAETVMSALKSCTELTYEWENPIVGELAETRVFPNDDGTCTYHSRDTETFHLFCIFDEEQRSAYADDILRQTSADSVQSRSFLENGTFVTEYTIDDGDEVFRSYANQAMNDGTCETYSTDPTSPLFKPPEERKG